MNRALASTVVGISMAAQTAFASDQVISGYTAYFVSDHSVTTSLAGRKTTTSRSTYDFLSRHFWAHQSYDGGVSNLLSFDGLGDAPERILDIVCPGLEDTNTFAQNYCPD